MRSIRAPGARAVSRPLRPPHHPRVRQQCFHQGQDAVHGCITPRGGTAGFKTPRERHSTARPRRTADAFFVPSRWPTPGRPLCPRPAGDLRGSRRTNGARTPALLPLRQQICAVRRSAAAARAAAQWRPPGRRCGVHATWFPGDPQTCPGGAATPAPAPATAAAPATAPATATAAAQPMGGRPPQHEGGVHPQGWQRSGVLLAALGPGGRGWVGAGVVPPPAASNAPPVAL